MATEGKKSKWNLSPRYWLEEVKAKDDLKNAAGKSVANVLIGVGGGTIATAIFGGKMSFGTGALLIGLGHYKDVPVLKPLGVGMMAASLMLGVEQILSGTEEVEGFDWKTQKEKAKERLHKLADTFMSHTYLDKVFKKKEQKKSADNSQRKVESGEEQYEEVNGLNAPASTELDNIEKQLIASAMEFQKKQQSKSVEGVDPELVGLEAEVDFSMM